MPCSLWRVLSNASRLQTVLHYIVEEVKSGTSIHQDSECYLTCFLLLWTRPLSCICWWSEHVTMKQAVKTRGTRGEYTPQACGHLCHAWRVVISLTPLDVGDPVRPKRELFFALSNKRSSWFSSFNNWTCKAPPVLYLEKLSSFLQ